MGQFSVGEVVTCIPMISRTVASGDYKIVAEMPERDGDRMYRIKKSSRRTRKGGRREPAPPIRGPFTRRGHGEALATRIDNTAKAEDRITD